MNERATAAPAADDTDPAAAAPGTGEFDRTGRVVLAAAVLAAGLTGPGQTIGVSVFTDHIVDDLGISRAGVSGAYLVGTMGGALLLPWVGRQVDRIGVRRAQTVVGLAFAAALAAMAGVQSLPTLALGFFGIRFLGQGSLSLIATVTVSLRFRARRGTALGIYAVATSGLMALVPILLAALIEAVSWRTAWVVAGLVIAATVAPLALLALRSLPTGTRTTHPDDATPEEGEATGDLDRGAAIRTRGFWILAAVSGTAGMLVTAFNFHQIDLLTDAGLGTSAAAASFAPQVIGATIAGFGSGWIADRHGTRFLPTASMLLLVAAHVVLADVGPGARVILYSTLLGAAAGSIRTITSTLLPSWFGTTHLGSIQGALTFLGVAASAIGPVTLAVLEPRLGGYGPAVLALAAIPVGVGLFALTDPKLGHRS